MIVEIMSDIVGSRKRKYGRIRYGVVVKIWSNIVKYNRGDFVGYVGHGSGNMIKYGKVWSGMVVEIWSDIVGSRRGRGIRSHTQACNNLFCQKA